MKQLFAKINQIDYAETGHQLTTKDFAIAREELWVAGFPQLPDEVIDFLKVYNGFLIGERCIWGIDNKRHYLYDILSCNLNYNQETNENILLLGETELTYIGWLEEKNCFAMIDKATFMVLHNFGNFAEAVKYILKIND